MAEPTAFSLSKMLSQLTGRTVSFSLLPASTPEMPKPLLAVYKMMPAEDAMVVKAELPLIASFGCALLGLPNEAVKEHLQAGVPDELLRDAMHEVMNVCSTPLSVEHRAVFQGLFTDPLYCGDSAQTLLSSKPHKTSFKVTIEGYTGGSFMVFSGN